TGQLRSDAAALGGAAPVVRDRGDVADEGHLEADPLERAKGALAARAGPLHEDRDRTHAVLHRLARRLFGRELRGEGGALARALEATRTSARPRDGVAVHVGDGHDRVVERRLDVRDPGRDVLLGLLLGRLGLAACAAGAGGSAGLRLGHERCSLLSYGRRTERLGRLEALRGGLARAGPDALAGPLAGSRVRVGALSIDGQPAAVPEASVAAEVHEPLDVHLDLAPEIALDLEVGVEHVADLLDLALGELFGLLGRCDAGLRADPSGRGRADAEEVRQRANDVLVAGEVDACDTSHDLSSLSLDAACDGGSRK